MASTSVDFPLPFSPTSKVGQAGTELDALTQQLLDRSDGRRPLLG